MRRASEGREALGFLLGPVAGASVLAVGAMLMPEFSASRLTVVLGVLLFCVAPGTIFIGLPVYYAIRTVRVPGPWWTAAFGLAISTAPAVAWGVLRVGAPAGISDQGWLIVVGTLGLGAAISGGIAGLVFWVLVFKGMRPVDQPNRPTAG